jgi:hypothetical protein
MNADSWSVSTSDVEMVPANSSREELIVACAEGGPVWLAFGKTAVVGKGVCLLAGSTASVKNHLCRLAVRGICDTGITATGGYQEV